MEKIFRLLVVVVSALTLFFWTMPYYDFMWFSNKQTYLLDQSGFGAIVPGSDIEYWGTLSIWLLLIPLSGVQILSPYEAFTVSLIGLIDGAILTMAYLTSVGEKFEIHS